MSFEHADCAIESIYGQSRLHVFSFGPNEQDNILCIDVLKIAPDVPLVRVQSACYTSEIFRSTDCDCHEQLHASLGLIHEQGGLLVYMLADGRGAGLLTKVRGLALGESEGLDTFDAYVRLGKPVDPRDYSRVIEVLHALKQSSIRLLTNNPRKVDPLKQAGIGVERVPIEIEPTDASRPYLDAKRIKFGHLLDAKFFSGSK